MNKLDFKRPSIVIFLVLSVILQSCGGVKKVDQRQLPDGAQAKAKKNIEEGRGVTIGGALRRGSTNYEFSTSNPMWRASLEVLDFMPLNTVDYSGGMIITDWYSDNNNENESLKITVRFLSNEVRSDSIKIIIHKKNCKTINNCVVNLASDSSIIKKEILSVILKKAALFEKESKNPKKDKKK